jgi:hypothetical protein
MAITLSFNHKKRNVDFSFSLRDVTFLINSITSQGSGFVSLPCEAMLSGVPSEGVKVTWWSEKTTTV